MRVVFWTHPPSTALVTRALSNVRAARFLDGSANQELVKTFLALAEDVRLFVPTALREIWVNLRNGLLHRRREFDRRLQTMAQRMSSDDIDASGLALQMLGTRFVLRGRFDRLDGTLTPGEPVLLIANHPYAPIDGLMLMSLVHQYRTDYSLLINANNSLVSVCPQYRSRLIPVDLFDGLLRTADRDAVRRSRVRAIRRGYERIEKHGECLILFPAGNVSKAKTWGDEITDTAWLDGVGFLVRRFASTGKRLTVLPVYIDTHMGGVLNSQRYQEAYIESRTHLPAALMQAFFNSPPTIDIHIGDPLSAEAFRNMDDAEITRVLRNKVYEHASVIPRASRLLTRPPQVREPITLNRLP